MTPARARGGAAASERPAPLARSAGQCLAAGQCPAGGPAADGSVLLAQPEAGEQPEGKKPAAVNAVRRAAWENASSPWRGRLRGRRRAGLSPRRRSAYRVRRRPALPGGGAGTRDSRWESWAPSALNSTVPKMAVPNAGPTCRLVLWAPPPGRRWPWDVGQRHAGQLGRGEPHDHAVHEQHRHGRRPGGGRSRRPAAASRSRTPIAPSSPIAAGMSSAEIAAAPVLSEGAVKAHAGRILAKLGLRDRVRAVIAGGRAGLASAAGPAAGAGIPHSQPPARRTRRDIRG